MRRIALLVCFGIPGCGPSAKAPETVPVYEEKQKPQPGEPPKNNSKIKVGYHTVISPMAFSMARTVFSRSASECSAVVMPAKPQKSTPSSNMAWRMA